MKKISTYIIILSALIIPNRSMGQDKAYILDRVVAVVGDFHVLQSDIEQQFLQLKASQGYVPDNVRCDILDYFIEQKLLMTQAKIDSIEVSPGQVEQSVDTRLQYFISQFGSEADMEEYFGKTIYEIRDDLRKTMRDLMITQQVEQSIVGDINTTPSEVKSFFKRLPKDSIPYIDSKVKLAQIVAYPPVNEDAVFAVKERLLELRKRIMDGENFATLAILYSDGPSAPAGGEIGFHGKGELDKAYVEAAWALAPGQVSKIVESDFGYHIIQAIERQGDRVNTRHILLQPTVDAASKGKALEKLDSLRTFILEDSLTFEMAAIYTSEDEDTRANGGMLVNPQTQASTFELTQLPTKDYYTIRDMNVGDISMPYETTDKNGKLCYKIVRLAARTEPHRANLQQDYLLLQNMALMEKQQEIMDEWYAKKKLKTYIKIDPSFSFCEENSSALTTN